MRTFSRVVRRHEREAILNSPAAFGGPFLRSDFGPSTVAVARRRRDALAVTGDTNSSLLSPRDQRTRRRKPRRSSWDYTGYSPSLREDNASVQRREGLREWDEEKARRRRHDEENPFADFTAINDNDIEDYYGEDGDIGRRTSGFEEIVLDTDSVQNLILQKPLVASPWIESPYFYTVDPRYLDVRGSGVYEPGSGRAGPASASSSNQANQTNMSSRGRRGAVTTMGETNHPPIVLRQPTPPNPPSPPRSHNGSSIELHEQPRTTK